ncbi:MAG: metallophosphoesterase family protein [Trueperaceae bacterium]|nr:metallophosphoesterase family protein [Trueperaceae bacterium]
MRYLVIGDVHGNLAALDAVLKDAHGRGFDAVAFLGDAVGYAPDADAVIERVAELAPSVAVAGNHDVDLLTFRDGGTPAAPLDADVADVLRRQADALSDASVAWLRALPRHWIGDAFEAHHGAPGDPWRYVTDLAAADAALDALHAPLALVGHTHVPRATLFVERPDGTRTGRVVPFEGATATYDVPAQARGFFNPGSVGQPRDGDPRAAYGVLDVGAPCRLEGVRVPYDVEATASAVRAAGYPERFAARLAEGL